MRKISLFTTAILLVGNLNAQSLGTQHGVGLALEASISDKIKPRYQGIILEVLDTKEYTYLKIDDKTPGSNPKKLKSFWIVVDKSSAKVGDYVRFQKELVTKNFKSKTLNRDFDEVMFASHLEYRVKN